jgi:PAS domain S-box-containing protein
MNKKQNSLSAHAVAQSWRESKDISSLFIDHAPASIALFDREMSYLAASRRWIEDFSIGNTDIIGVSHYKIFTDISEEWKDVHRRGLAGESIRSDGDRFVRTDGPIHWLKWEVVPWHTNKGEIGGIVIFSEDITKDKKTEKIFRDLNTSLEDNLHELRTHQIELEMQNEALLKSQVTLEASRDRYFNLYEFASFSLITITQSGQIAKINLTGSALLGEDRRKLLDHRFDMFVAPEHRSQWQQFFLKTIRDTEKHSCELMMRTMGNTAFYVHLVGRLINTEEGVPELQITLVDITEQKLMEAAKGQFEKSLLLLTPRERDVLVLALTGLQNKEIAFRLNIHIRTVENHRARIHNKTGVVSMIELAQLAFSAGVSLADIKLQ